MLTVHWNTYDGGCLESTSCNLVVREPAMIAPYQPPPTPYPTPPPIIHLPHLPPRSTCICPAKNSVPSILLQQREVVFSKLKGCNTSCYNPLSIESPKKMSHHEWTFAFFSRFSSFSNISGFALCYVGLLGGCDARLSK